MGGMLDVCCNTLVVWVWKDQAGPWLQLLHFCFGAGGFLSPILVTHIDNNFEEIEWTYYLVAVIISPASLGLFFLESPKGEDIDVHGAHGLPVSPKEKGNLPTELVEIAEPPIPSEKSITDSAEVEIQYEKEEETRLEGVGFWKMVRIVASIGGFFFMCTGVEIGLSVFLVSYLIQRGITEPEDDVGNYITSGFWAALTIGRLVIVPLAAYVSPPAILIGDIIGCLASSLVLVIFPKKLAACWISSVGTGAFMASTSPAALAYPAWAGVSLSGQAVSYILVIGNLGELLVPLLISLLMDAADDNDKGSSIYFVWINFVAFICAGVFLVLMIITLTKEDVSIWRGCLAIRNKFRGFNRVTLMGSMLADNSIEGERRSQQEEEEEEAAATEISDAEDHSNEETQLSPNTMASSSPSPSPPPRPILEAADEEEEEEPAEGEQENEEETGRPEKSRRAKRGCNSRDTPILSAGLRKWRVFSRVVGRMLNTMSLIVKKKTWIPEGTSIRPLLRISRDNLRGSGEVPISQEGPLALPSPTSPSAVEQEEEEEELYQQGSTGSVGDEQNLVET